MKANAIRTAMFWASSLALLLGHAAAEELTSRKENGQAAVPIDIALDANGNFQGVLADAKGIPLANETIVLHAKQGPIKMSVTDQRGRFQFSEMRGGVNVIAYGDQANLARFWAHCS